MTAALACECQGSLELCASKRATRIQVTQASFNQFDVVSSSVACELVVVCATTASTY